MQLQNLARQVLVDAELALGIVPRGESSRLGIGPDGVLVIEKGDHGRVLFHGGQHVDESAVDVRPDRLVLQRARHAVNCALIGRYREMIGPEMHQAFGERLGRERGAAGSGQHLGSIVRHVGIAQHVQLELDGVGVIGSRSSHFLTFLARRQHRRENLRGRGQRSVTGTRNSASRLDPQPCSRVAGCGG